MAKRDDRRRQERLASRRADAEAPWVRDEALKRMLLNAAWLAMLDLKTRPARKKFESRFYLSDAESHGARPVVGPSVVAWRETSALVGVRDDEGRVVLARIMRSSASGSLAVLASTGRHEADLEFVDVDDLKDHVATSCEGGFVGIPFFLCDMVRDASSDRTLFKPWWAGRVDPGWDRGGWEKAIKVVRRNPRRGDERRLGRLAARGDAVARRRLLPAWVDELRLRMLGEALEKFESSFEPEDGEVGLVIVACREGEATSLSTQRRWRRALGGPGSPIVDGFVILPLDVEWGAPGLAATFGAGAFAAAAFCRSPWLGEALSESVVLFVPDGPHEEGDPAGLAAFLREEAGAESFVIDRRLIPGPRANPRKADRRRRERLEARGDIDAGARALLERMSRGEVTREQVRLAASLGDPRAMRLEPGQEPAPWKTQNDRVAMVAEVVRFTMDPSGLAVAFSVDCARRVVHLARGEPAATRAIEVAEHWLLDRAEERVKEARTCAADAHDSVVRERDRGRGDGSVANAIRAARDAAYVVEDWFRPAFAYVFVANAAQDAADAAEDREAEVAWQRARLAAYALGEIRVPGPRRNPREDDRRRLERRAARGDDEARRRLGRGRPAQSPALVGDLRWLFGMDAEKAELARGLIDGDVDPLEFESVAAWERQCHHAPPRVDMVMKAVCELVGGYGVEAIRCQGWHGSYHHEIHASCVNADEGPTLILDHEGTFFVTTLEDYLEEQSRDRPECFPGPSGNPRGERRRLERRAARGDEEARKRLEADEKARKPLSPEDVDLELLRVSREVGAFLSELAPDVGRVAWDAASGGSGSCLSESRLSEGVCRFFHVNVSVESSGRRRLATITVSRDVGRGQAPRYETDASASTSLTDAELRAWLEARGRPDRVTGTRWIATAGNLWFDLAVARKDGGDA